MKTQQPLVYRVTLNGKFVWRGRAVSQQAALRAAKTSYLGQWSDRAALAVQVGKSKNT